MKEATAIAKVWFFFFESLSTYFSTNTILFCWVIFVHFCIPGFVQSLKFQEEGERITLHIAPACVVFISWWTIHLGLTSKWPFWFQTRQQGLASTLAGQACFSGHIICVHGHRCGAWGSVLVTPGLFYCCTACTVYFGSLMSAIRHQVLNVRVVRQHHTCWREERGEGCFRGHFQAPFAPSVCSMVSCSS